MKILIVDDHYSLRLLIAEIITGKNEQVFEACNIKDALEIYERERPEWVVTDIRLNDENGLHLAELLKEKYSDSKVIVITNFNEPEYRETAETIGVEGFVLKDNLWSLKYFFSQEMN